MNLFSNVIAEFSCRECGRRVSVVTPTFSRFFVLVAAATTLPLWIGAMTTLHLPWYHLFGLFAGELLVVHAAGFLSSLVLIFYPEGASRCRSCRAPMTFHGRHFDPKGTRKPHWKDFLLLVIYIALNAIILATWRHW